MLDTNYTLNKRNVCKFAIASGSGARIAIIARHVDEIIEDEGLMTLINSWVELNDYIEERKQRFFNDCTDQFTFDAVFETVESAADYYDDDNYSYGKLHGIEGCINTLLFYKGVTE